MEGQPLRFVHLRLIGITVGANVAAFVLTQTGVVVPYAYSPLDWMLSLLAAATLLGLLCGLALKGNSRLRAGVVVGLAMGIPVFLAFTALAYTFQCFISSSSCQPSLAKALLVALPFGLAVAVPPIAACLGSRRATLQRAAWPAAKTSGPEFFLAAAAWAVLLPPLGWWLLIALPVASTGIDTIATIVMVAAAVSLHGRAILRRAIPVDVVPTVAAAGPAAVVVVLATFLVWMSWGPMRSFAPYAMVLEEAIAPVLGILVGAILAAFLPRRSGPYAPRPPAAG